MEGVVDPSARTRARRTAGCPLPVAMAMMMGLAAGGVVSDSCQITTVTDTDRWASDSDGRVVSGRTNKSESLGGGRQV